MRKNLRYKAISVFSRNDLIDELKQEKEVIVLENVLLADMIKEINDNQKKGKVLKNTGLTVGLLFGLLASNPLG